MYRDLDTQTKTGNSLLSIESNLIRLGGPVYEIVIKTAHESLPESLFCLLKLGLIVSSQISSKFTRVVVY